MPNIPMKTPKTHGFTILELVVVIAIVVILAGIALPAFMTTCKKGRQTMALSDVKQILLACKIFATDHNGEYPTYALDPKTLKPSVAAGRIPAKLGSNGAFAGLFPDYLTNETIFCVQGSAFTPILADNVIDNPAKATPVETLKAGENTFAYCLGLTDKSNSLFPLITDGFADVGTWTFSKDKKERGGIWEGKKAVMGLVDGSASIMKVDQTSMTVMGNPADPSASCFSTSIKGAQSWLSAPANVWLNPL